MSVEELWLDMERAPTDGREVELLFDMIGDEAKPAWPFSRATARWGEFRTKAGGLAEAWLLDNGQIAGLYDPIRWRPADTL